MKLDPRIKSLSDILTCFDIERAEQFIGQKGYFADGLSCYHNLANRTYDTLTHIKDGDYPFKEGNDSHWRYFIPECSLKPKEKQYRPYTLMEFNDKFTVGRPIKFRKKGEVGNERYLILNGYSHNKLFDEITTDIYIGRGAYTLDELFNKYEWQEHYTEDFEPFGVEVEE